MDDVIHVAIVVGVASVATRCYISGVVDIFSYSVVECQLKCQHVLMIIM